MSTLKKLHSKFFFVALMLLIGLGWFQAPQRAISPGLKLTSNISVTLDVPETSIIFDCLTSPNAFIIVSENGSTVASTTSDSNGNSRASLLGITPTIHNLKLYAEDSSGAITSTASISISAEYHAQAVVDIFLAPTIGLTSSSYKQTETDILSGQTYPEATVFLQFASGLSVGVVANSLGVWSQDLGKLNLPVGTNSVYVSASTASGLQSYPSNSISFVVDKGPKPIISSTTSSSGAQKNNPTTTSTENTPSIPNTIKPLLPSNSSLPIKELPLSKILINQPSKSQGLTTAYATVLTVVVLFSLAALSLAVMLFL